MPNSKLKVKVLKYYTQIEKYHNRLYNDKHQHYRVLKVFVRESLKGCLPSKVVKVKSMCKIKDL